MCFGNNKSVESIPSNAPHKRSPKVQRKKSSGSEQSLKQRPRKQPSKTKTGPSQPSRNNSPAGRNNSPPGVKQVFPVLKQNIARTAPVIKQVIKPGAKETNPVPKRGNSPGRTNSPGPKQNESPPQPKKINSILDIKGIFSKGKVASAPNVHNEPSPKLKVKTRGVLTKEVYPVVLTEKNKETRIDDAKARKISPGKQKAAKLPPQPSTSVEKRKRLNPARSLKLKVRKQLWNWSKHTLKDNEHFGKLFKENSIDVDKINIDKLDLSLINMDALGIENKFVKRTVEWLLK